MCAISFQEGSFFYLLLCHWGLVEGLFRLGFLKGGITGGFEGVSVRFQVLHGLPEGIGAA